MMPTSTPKPTGRRESVLTSDSAGLVVIGFLCFCQFMAVWNSVDDFLFVGPAHYFDFLHPSVGSAVPWLVIAVVCFVSTGGKFLQPLAISLSVGIHFLWGMSYFTGWITGVSHDSWIFSLSYFGSVALILYAVARGRAIYPLAEEGGG